MNIIKYKSYVTIICKYTSMRNCILTHMFVHICEFSSFLNNKITLTEQEKIFNE